MTEVITKVMNLEEKIDSLTSIHSERMLMLHREREKAWFQNTQSFNMGKRA